MKIKLLALLFTSFVICHSSFGQGALTPPGAPVPTMKTLDQIEARTPVDATHTPGAGTNLFLINQPGAYYLTGNINISSGNAIAIVTNGVTLDLNGFTIFSTNAAADTAVLLSGGSVENITILNGHIQGGVKYSLGSFSGTGFQKGINTSTPFGANPRNIRVSGVTVSGCTTHGINLGVFSSVGVDHCNVYAINGSGNGISAGTVNDCAVDACNGTAINSFTAANSSGTSVGSGTGVFARSALNCVGVSATGAGLNAQVATGSWGESTGIGSGTGVTALTANGCYGSADNSTGAGVSADIVTASRGFSSAGVGINASTANSCYAVTGSSTSNALQVVAVAANSYGSAPGGAGAGLFGTIVSDSYGLSASGYGISASNVVANSYGRSTSNYGVLAQTALNSVGEVDSGFYGVYALTDLNCYGHCITSGTGLSGTLMYNCEGASANGTGVSGFSSSFCFGFGSTPYTVLHSFNSY